MKILIPTMLSPEQVAPQIEAIRAVTPDADIFASCLQASASVNRNACLDQIEVGDVACMIDDDIEGFYPHWRLDLLASLWVVPGTVMVSARLLNPDGSFGPTCSRCFAREPMEIVLKPHPNHAHCIMPSAAIAFVHRGHRFPADVLRGSGWEDNWFCAEYVEADPDAVFVQSNRCQLRHLNQQKGQHGENWAHNKAEFFKRWPRGIPWKW